MGCSHIRFVVAVALLASSLTYAAGVCVITSYSIHYTKLYDTASVANADFLHAIFGPLTGDVRPMVCSIIGNPSTAPGLSWRNNFV